MQTQHADNGSAKTNYTYLDCLQGKTPVPRTPNGRTLFLVLMTGGMVTFMVTVNGIRHTGLGFLAQSHWLYPFMFAIAFLVRTFIASRIVDAVAPRLVLNRLQGVPRNIAMTVLNTSCMAPIMCAVSTLLLVGVHDFAFSYLTTLPIMAPTAMLVNFFIVGPAAKLIYHRIEPADGLGFIADLRAKTPALTQLLGC